VPAVERRCEGQDATVGGFAGLLLGLQHHGAGAIAEQHAGSPVVPVENAREGLAPITSARLNVPVRKKTVRARQRKDKARADRLQIETPPLMMPSSACTATAVAGKVLSGVEVASTMRSIDCASTPALASAARAALTGQMRGELALGGDVALPDAGALHDPLVRGV